MTDEMIRIDDNPAAMARAIERAKSCIEKMRVSHKLDNTYTVRNGGGKCYTVTFTTPKNMILAHCDCPNQNRSVCKHMAGAVVLHIARQVADSLARTVPAPAPRRDYCGDKQLQHLAMLPPFESHAMAGVLVKPQPVGVVIEGWQI